MQEASSSRWTNCANLADIGEATHKMSHETIKVSFESAKSESSTTTEALIGMNSYTSIATYKN